MKIIDYKTEHLFELNVQPYQLSDEVTPEYAEWIGQYPCYTAIHDGKVVAVGGLVPMWPGRAVMYLRVSDGISYQWISLFRAAKKVIYQGLKEYHRLEAQSEFPESERWLQMLGFKYEGVMRKYRPDGQDVKMWSIVRGD